MHAHVDRFLGAHFLAVAAEDAAELVDLVDQRITVALFILARHELDAVGGTNLGAEPARHAFRPALLVGEHAMRAAPAGGQRPVLGRLLLGILHRDLGTQQMAEGQRHPFQRRAQVGGLLRRPLHDLHADSHQAASSWTEPDTMRPRSSQYTSAISSTRFNPPRAQAIPGPYSQPSRIRMNQIATANSVDAVTMFEYSAM